MRKHGGALVMAIALIVAFIGLGIAYAAFSTTLTITGSATVNSSSWNIYYTNASKGSKPSAAVSITPTATGGATGTGSLTATDFTWDGTFTKPGGKLVYTFYIYNKGNYDAKISNINTPTISCTKGGSSESTVCGKISYDVYKNSTGTTKLTTSDTLAAGASMQVYVIASLADTFKADGSDLPNAAVTVSPSTISIQWAQN